MKKRNQTLDVIKLIAAFLVVFIHVPFYGTFGKVVNLYTRIAVPVFFMTSGYFCYENTEAVIWKKIRKIAGILVFAALLYTVCNLVLGFLADGLKGIKSCLLVYGSWERWMGLLLLNQPFAATRLWFLYALIYVYALQIFFQKRYISYKTIGILSACGLVGHIALCCGCAAAGIELPGHMSRNWMLFGYPFFGCGLLFRHGQNRILQFSRKKAAGVFVVGAVLSLLPLIFPSNAQYGIGTICLVFSIFIFAMQNPQIQYPTWILSLCRCNLGIYILHRPVATVVGKALSVIGLTEHTVLYAAACSILVCILTTMLTWILLEIRERTAKRDLKAA